MSLTSEQLDRLGALLLAMVPGENPVAAVRAELPQIKVSRCDATDMRGETPYRCAGDYAVFLVDTGSHCWRIVDDPQAAGGVVIVGRA